jgi:hypothetical protein
MKMSGEVEVRLIGVLIQHKMETSGQLQTPDWANNEPWYTWAMRYVWLEGSLDTEKTKIPIPAGNRTLTVQPVA